MDNIQEEDRENNRKNLVRYPHICSFGSSRRSSLSSHAQRVWDSYHILYALSMEDLSRWSCGRGKPKIVEIGCGMGEATVEIASRYPERDYLAIDIYRPGLARILQECHNRDILNLKILEGDAMLAIDELEQGSISGFHIFFPDPWPKYRHHKRRFMREEMIQKMGKCLKKGGFLYFITDWFPYSSDALKKLSTSPFFRNSSLREDGFFKRTFDRPTTRFEKKGLEKGHNIWELYFERV